jgi:tetratricopeptide (TPR) repeat protein
LPYLRDYSQSIYWLGTTLAKMKGGQDEAEEMYRLAIDKQDELLAALKDDKPTSKELRRDIERDKARMLNNLGLLYGLTGRKNKAIEIFQAAQEIQKTLVANNRDIPTIRREEARTLNNEAFQQWQTEGKRTSAEDNFAEAIQLLEMLIREFPSVPAYRDDLATVYRTRGGLLQAVERPEEAEAAFRKALAIHLDLTKEFPQLPDYQSRLSDDYLAIGRLQMLENRYSSTCEEMLAKALELQNDLVKKFPDNCEYHSNLSNTYKVLATRIDRRRLSQMLPYALEMYSTGTLVSAASVAQLDAQGACAPSGTAMNLACAALAAAALNAEGLRKNPQMIQRALEPARRAVKELRKALELEPRRVDYLAVLKDGLIDLGITELKLKSHVNVAKIAEDIAELEPTDPSARMTAADFLARATVLVQRDSNLNEHNARTLQQRYADAALANLETAGRLDAQYTLTKLLDINGEHWKDLRERPQFKEVMDKLKAQAKANDT